MNIVRRAFSSDKIKFYDVVHPNIPIPPCLTKINDIKKGFINEYQSFMPLDYQKQKFIEQIRTGEYLGNDSYWTYHKSDLWVKRKYNLPIDPIPALVGRRSGINWIQSRREWHVSWIEDGIHRSRIFNGGLGILKSRNAAVKYYDELSQMGKIDKFQTERQKRQATLKKLSRERFIRTASRLRTKEELIAIWDAYWDKAKHHMDDNHVKTQLKKYGKILDPRYKPPDIDIKKVRDLK